MNCNSAKHTHHYTFTYIESYQIIMSNTVKVSGISGQTGEKEIRDFFSFW